MKLAEPAAVDLISVQNGTNAPVSVQIDANASAHVQSAVSASLSTDVIVGLKAKCELTGAILEHFEDFRKDSKYENRYSAKCTLCGKQDDTRKYFQKGNNSNLKSHLQRVSKLN